MHHFHVPDIQCGGCLRSIRQALQALDPQAQVEADLESRVVAVATDREEAAILAALHRAGYAARPLSQQHA
ncbi:heavy-metal-associated domain-containing protein [Microvirga sesbaniae]|uniref:heavy-metal-associated domain-containing protein n=1 Tax=Microvirga sesbaniae TaxID=681392 RepID=UPI0021C8E6F6|nr:heavy-metal-associated domain-containing protein [Microvirga sp. HBU67692]